MKPKHATTTTAAPAAKRRMPVFVRQDGHRFKRLDSRWRRPRGIHSKMREHRKGNPPVVSIGYRSPATERGLLADGRRAVRVHHLRELTSLDPRQHTLVLAASLGTRKRLSLLAMAAQQGFSLRGVRDAAAAQVKLQNAWKERSRTRAELRKQRSAAGKQPLPPPKKQDKRTPAPPQPPTKEQENRQREEQRREAEKVMISS